MTKRFILCAGLAGLALATAPMTFAQSAPNQGGEHHGGGAQRGFEAMDSNHDGVITLDEWKAAGRREERFKEIDADHDGTITREELRAFMDKMRAEHQRNGNGGNWGGGQNEGH